IAATHEPSAATVRLPLVMPAGIRVANPDIAVGSGVTLSPDGHRAAFVGWSGSVRGLYVRNVGDIEARPIYRDGSSNPGQPTFSPDGKWIAFTEGRRLKKVLADGGTPVVLADNIAVPMGAAWTSDGRIIVATGRTLLSIPEAGGTVDTLVRPDSS